MIEKLVRTKAGAFTVQTRKNKSKSEAKILFIPVGPEQRSELLYSMTPEQKRFQTSYKGNMHTAEQIFKELQKEKLADGEQTIVGSLFEFNFGEECFAFMKTAYTKRKGIFSPLYTAVYGHKKDVKSTKYQVQSRKDYNVLRKAFKTMLESDVQCGKVEVLSHPVWENIDLTLVEIRVKKNPQKQREETYAYCLVCETKTAQQFIRELQEQISKKD